ncbi:hypothetical protein [Desulfoplanes formicivorans]|uniref:DUF1643 domain-containing protein n=1 Tax=Desulfoplanes formicivorans TaxID=1592317 RepID=A0A194AFY5_9BACT|nr:hypothetical protein [Desulfoplanes formicivorans]GAU08243.1 hypothetical protein DPF_0946 [Desulfoplanes formicivorans]
MVPFIPASQLKSRYNVLGHFYSLAFSSGRTVDCRSVLEIVAKRDVPQDVSGLSETCPDAVCIMMNPGSSRPLVKVDTVIPASRPHDIMHASLVPTHPDITQYQVMRLMHYLSWQHVRVVNLSDLRDPKSGKFVERFTVLEAEEQSEIHCVFSGERKKELARRLGPQERVPVICAWGVSSELDPLIGRCMQQIAGRRVLGLLKQGTVDKYFHPLPTLQRAKEAWVSDMVALCRQGSEQ